MVAEEKSIRIYDTKRTFFTKIGNTFSKLLTPTKVGINNMLISIKRASVVKNYKNMINAKDNKKEVLESKFEESYSLYLEAVDGLVIETVYKKVRQDNASDFEKDALSRYYNIIHLKENDETEYKYKKAQYLLNLDYTLLKNENKKISEDFNNLYIYKMDQSYKGLLKHYSIKLPEKKVLPAQKEEMYSKIFDALEEYTQNIVSLKNIEAVVMDGKRELYREFGELLFTHFGVSGPVILSASSFVAKVLKKRELTIYIDLKPALDMEQLDARIVRDFEEFSNKQFKNALGHLYPTKLIPVIIERSGIPPEKKVNEITKEERRQLVVVTKRFVVTLTGLRDFKEAIITQGGVLVKEINPKTMESKLVKNLYFAGEVLDLDGVTGGFNLQIAWSTGWAAGSGII